MMTYRNREQRVVWPVRPEKRISKGSRRFGLHGQFGLKSAVLHTLLNTEKPWTSMMEGVSFNNV